MLKRLNVLAICLVAFMLLSACATTGSVDTAQFVSGIRTATEYESEWLGLRYTLSEEMSMMSDEEIYALTEAAVAQYGEVLSDSINFEDLPLLFEFLALNIYSSNNISVSVEKLSQQGVTEQAYAMAVKSSYLTMYEEVSFFDDSQRDVAGVDFYEVSLIGSTAGTAFYQMQLFKKIDDRMVTITMTCFDTDNADELLAGFSAY